MAKAIIASNEPAQAVSPAGIRLEIDIEPDTSIDWSVTADEFHGPWNVDGTSCEIPFLSADPFELARPDEDGHLENGFAHGEFRPLDWIHDRGRASHSTGDRSLAFIRAVTDRGMSLDIP
jgi:hypothetical protein